jgi:hypothetical protein
MNTWYYYIPHRWDNQRKVWEDIYLLPDFKDWSGESLWMTIDAALFKTTNEYEEHIVCKRCELLGDNEFYVDQERLDVVVYAEDFDLPELLEWVRKVMNSLGLGPVELIEGPAAMFAGTNLHSQMIGEATDVAEAYRNENDEQSAS